MLVGTTELAVVAPFFERELALPTELNQHVLRAFYFQCSGMLVTRWLHPNRPAQGHNIDVNVVIISDAA